MLLCFYIEDVCRKLIGFLCGYSTLCLYSSLSVTGAGEQHSKDLYVLSIINGESFMVLKNMTGAIFCT